MRRAFIESWKELKREMRERFVLCYYKRDLFIKLQRIFQDTKSVEEYYKEIEVTLIRAQIFESQEVIMARFFNGLNRHIQDVVELHEYTSICTLVHQASKVETQIGRPVKKVYPTISSIWKGKERRDEKPLKRDKSPKKGSTPFKGHNEECLEKGHIASQCINKRTMILRDKEDIEKETSTSRSEGGYSSEEVPYEGDLLMVRRLMSAFIKDDQSQRENIFHSRCMIQGKVFSLIIDGGCSVNVVSQRLVDKFLLFPTLSPINFNG
ncbi:hypothetical protein CR513_19922, partial [Mucuna pruriens]